MAQIVNWLIAFLVDCHAVGGKIFHPVEAPGMLQGKLTAGNVREIPRGDRD
jgi:hypothetical protein